MSKIIVDTFNTTVEIFSNLQTTFGGQSFTEFRSVPHEAEAQMRNQSCEGPRHPVSPPDQPTAIRTQSACNNCHLHRRQHLQF